MMRLTNASCLTFFCGKYLLRTHQEGGRGRGNFIVHTQNSAVCTGRPHDKHARVHDISRLRMYEWAN